MLNPTLQLLTLRKELGIVASLVDWAKEGGMGILQELGGGM